MNKKPINIGLFGVTFFFVNVSLILFPGNFLRAQPAYNQCSQALELCPNVSVGLTNHDANVTVCTPCDDNFTACFVPNNSIWLKFTTNALGGSAQVDFSNLVFEIIPGQDTEIQATIIRAGAPCDGTTYVLQGNCVMNATTNFTLSANFLPNTLYYVVVDGAKNGPGITQAAEFTLDAILSGPAVDRPVPGINVDYTDNLCKNKPASFTAHLTNCPDSLNYKWYINGILVAETVDSTFETTALNDGDVLSVSNSCYTQCPVSPTAATPPLNVISFLVDAGPNKTIAPGESVQLNGNTSAINFLWTPNIDLSSNTNLTPTVSPDNTTTYFLTAYQHGCSITDEVVVTVGLELEITNTFSPNEDGKNDTWEIPGLVNYPNCLVEIFDRWGQLVFTATGYNEKKSWDGQKNGKKLTPGVYYYVIELRDGNSDKLTGYLNLIR